MILFSTIIVSKPVAVKIPSPIFVTLLGIVIDVKPVQPKKAPSPIVVMLLGIVIDVKPEQPQNAPSPIAVTLTGMTVFLHPVISVLVSVSIIALLLSRES